MTFMPSEAYAASSNRDGAWILTRPMKLNLSKEAQERWRGLNAERRRRVQAAIGRGERVSDPGDAQLAVELASISRAQEILGLIALLLLVPFAGFALRGLGNPLVWAVIAVTYLAAIPTWYVRSARLTQAQRLNAESLGPGDIAPHRPT